MFNKNTSQKSINAKNEEIQYKETVDNVVLNEEKGQEREIFVIMVYYYQYQSSDKNVLTHLTNTHYACYCDLALLLLL